MKQSTPCAVMLAALCLVGCERNDGADRRTDRADDVVEPGVPKPEPPVGVQAAGDHELAEHDARSSAAGPEAPVVVDSPRDPDDPSLVDKAREARQAFAAAARRRLEKIEHDLQQVEQRSRERGTEMRTDVREDKQRLEADLEKLGKETEEAWDKAKGGFADALDRLENQVERLRKDVDPDA